MSDKMTFATNQKVKTPYGEGYVQGPYQDGGYLVRLPVKDVPYKSTITPRAIDTGLYSFQPNELKAVIK